MDKNSKLVFVYNANSGFVNSLIDYVHKAVSPSTYECNLCLITYDNKGMKKDWKEFVNNLENPVEFLHKDKLEEQYGMKNEALPAIYIKGNGNLKLFISQKEINMAKTVEELEVLVTRKINENNE